MKPNHQDSDKSDWPGDVDKECGTAEFASVDGLDKYKTAIEKHRVLAEAMEAGCPGIDPIQIQQTAEKIAQILVGLCRTYSLTAIRAGSINDRIDLPQFFRNESGTEDPGDPATIAEMAAARGQVLRD